MKPFQRVESQLSHKKHHNKEFFEQSLVEINARLEKNPRDVEALIEKSSCLRHLRREEETIEVHNLLISIDPDNPEFHFMKGLVLIEFFREEESLACFDRVLELHPTHRDALFNKGLALSRLGRKAEAREFMRKAMSG